MAEPSGSSLTGYKSVSRADWAFCKDAALDADRSVVLVELSLSVTVVPSASFSSSSSSSSRSFVLSSDDANGDTPWRSRILKMSSESVFSSFSSQVSWMRLHLNVLSSRARRPAAASRVRLGSVWVRLRGLWPSQSTDVGEVGAAGAMPDRSSDSQLSFRSASPSSSSGDSDREELSPC